MAERGTNQRRPVWSKHTLLAERRVVGKLGYVAKRARLRSVIDSHIELWNRYDADLERAAQERYERDWLVQLLIEHQLMSYGRCSCGWGAEPQHLGLSWADHVADVYEGVE